MKCRHLPLRVLTANICSFNYTSRPDKASFHLRRRWPLLWEQIRAVDPDVIFLQEIRRSSFGNVLASLVEKYDVHYRFFNTQTSSLGLAIAVKHEKLFVQSFRFFNTHREPAYWKKQKACREIPWSRMIIAAEVLPVKQTFPDYRYFHVGEEELLTDVEKIALRERDKTGTEVNN